jgi:two-component system nitrate/nitrite response regulator NarL
MTQSHDHTSGSIKSVLVVHPQLLICEAICHMVRHAGFRILGHAPTVQALDQLAAKPTPDIILLYWALLDGGADVIRALAEEFPQSTIIILTYYQPPSAIIAGIRAGANGFLSLNLSPEEFTNSLHRIARGNVVVSREMSVNLLQALACDGLKEPFAKILPDLASEVLKSDCT